MYEDDSDSDEESETRRVIVKRKMREYTEPEPTKDSGSGIGSMLKTVAYVVPPIAAGVALGYANNTLHETDTNNQKYESYLRLAGNILGKSAGIVGPLLAAWGGPIGAIGYGLAAYGAVERTMATPLLKTVVTEVVDDIRGAPKLSGVGKINRAIETDPAMHSRGWVW